MEMMFFRATQSVSHVSEPDIHWKPCTVTKQRHIRSCKCEGNLSTISSTQILLGVSVQQWHTCYFQARQGRRLTALCLSVPTIFIMASMHLKCCTVEATSYGLERTFAPLAGANEHWQLSDEKAGQNKTGLADICAV